jgi:enamine deaminase RidA (YjgF/YER057c/UK114 family)
MGVERINPKGLYKATKYTHVTIGRGSRVVFIAGQAAVDENDVIVSMDYSTQAQKAHENLRIALAAAGARPEDVLKITSYVVNLTPENKQAVFNARFATFGDTLPASVLVGVERLGRPEYLLEVDAVAIVD